MRVLIDGDGCPVVGITAQICMEKGIACLLLCDTAHEMCREGVQVITVDKGADSVDYAIVSRVLPGDIVITQDYGLASMCLARKARVLHQDGWEYTPQNIDALLLERHEARKFRQLGGRTKGNSKRKKEQNDAFSASLLKLLEEIPRNS